MVESPARSGASPPRRNPGLAASTVHCHVEGFSGLEVRGWAYDGSRPDEPVALHLIVDGQEVGQVVCTETRHDVAAACGCPPERVGFRHLLPDALLDEKAHRMTMRDRAGRPVALTIDGTSSPHVDFTLESRPRVRSCVDGVRQGAFKGWVLRSDRGGPMRGDCVIRVVCDGAVIGHARANRHRADVARALSAPAACGFEFVPPASVRRGCAQRYQFFLVPEGIELEDSPYTTRLVDDAQEARLLELVDAVDRLHRELTWLRREIRELLPEPRHTLASYDAWLRRYAPALRRRVEAARDPAAPEPLVSVLCPVYRPRLAEFRATVESVLAQTWRNWELILVDDGSGDAELTALIERLVAGEPRVRALPSRENRGISGATNRAIRAARGEWVAFLDHDDLLADVALECAMAAARDGSVQVLYSDEDKVDEAGFFEEPALKPDWNHRLALGVNYVCHLLIVRRDALDRAGPLDGGMDGAQDHDLVLRLAETVPEGAIRHVPEILYHWRKTAASTASDLSTKRYAVDAGVAAVSAHLARLGRPAEVSSRGATTLYDVRWRLAARPPVTVIVPFRDQLEMTGECLECLLGRTRYPALDVILVDNWSTAEGLDRFARSAARHSNVRVMRVEEPFNYSRLNNLAAAETNAELLVFMNNDLFVENEGWLEAAVGEAAADPRAAVVGGRFAYPSGTLQHAGIALGLGGVAGHLHVGVPRDEGGYAGRASLAQELSAVTGAGMLVRHRVFDEVGGFDEEALQVAFNDVDLCLRVRAAGYKVLYTPDFRAVHRESASRGDDERPSQETRFFLETETMKARWGDALTRDPFYSKHFWLDGQPFNDLVQPERTDRA